MKIPYMPKQKVITPDGNLHPEWRRFFDSFTNELQRNVPDEGYYLPPQPTANVTQLNTQKSKGGMLYDSDKQAMHINNDGTYRPVQVTKIQMTTAQRTAVPANKRDDLWVHDTDTSKLYTGISGTWKEVTLT